MNRPVVVAVGYSVRALVEACSRSGLECIAVDHFGDADTRSFARGRWIGLEFVDDRFISQHTLSEIEKTVSDLQSPIEFAFLLAGGMENLGEAVEQLRSLGTVLGPTEAQRSKLRDWTFLRTAATEAGIEFPKTLAANDVVPLNASGNIESWLWKPLHGAGGLKIARANFINQTHHQGYWQHYVAGRPIGICCVSQPKHCLIVGASLSFDAADWPGPSEFIYRGSMGPLELKDDTLRRVTNLCDRIQRQLGYLGLLQFDFIHDTKGRLWLLECNPRWTAGMEVLLDHGDEGDHARGWLFDALFSSDANAPVGLKPPVRRGRKLAKAVVYAEHEIHLTQQTVLNLQLQSQDTTGDFTWLADIPHAAQTIELGHPIATVRASLDDPTNTFSEADTHSQLLTRLRSCANRLHGLLLQPK